MLILDLANSTYTKSFRKLTFLHNYNILEKSGILQATCHVNMHAAWLPIAVSLSCRGSNKSTELLCYSSAGQREESQHELATGMPDEIRSDQTNLWCLS
jgi:hypothetical protein